MELVRGLEHKSGKGGSGETFSLSTTLWKEAVARWEVTQQEDMCQGKVRPDISKKLFTERVVQILERVAQESGLATISGNIQKKLMCHLGTWLSGGPGFAE
ncbi:hypothetical protein TURU_037320 [Turdus rufiventris]|nr:hypothetical protein TURU_037320 [Turdus rufiventris]